MRKILGSIGTFILFCLVIVVLGIILYLTLELFNIIHVPEKYSLMNFLYSKIEMIHSAQDYIETELKDKSLIEFLKQSEKEYVTVELNGNTVTTIQLENYEEPEEENISDISFKYYDQLDENAKIMYNAFEENKDKLKSGNHTFDFGTAFNSFLQKENANEELKKSFQLAVNAFSFDNPEIFYIDITKIYLLTEITKKPFSTTYEVSIGPNETGYLYEQYTSEADVDNAINQLEQIKNTIKQNAQGTTFEKIKYIHDYLLETIEYEKNSENYNNYNIYGALINKKAVCEGYANAFKYFLDDLEIPCFVVCGTATNSSGLTESHAWNYAQIDNSLYAVDVTWDDPIIIGNGRITEDIKYKYFLKGSDSFFTNHVEDGSIIESANFTYPALSGVDY